MSGGGRSASDQSVHHTNTSSVGDVGLTGRDFVDVARSILANSSRNIEASYRSLDTYIQHAGTNTSNVTNTTSGNTSSNSSTQAANALGGYLPIIIAATLVVVAMRK